MAKRRRKVTMDRVFEVSKRINIEWGVLNSELQLLALRRADKEIDAIQKRYEKLANDFANLITLGQDDSWRFLAESNGFHQEGE